MDISWLGHGCFRLRGREATVITDPCPPSTGYKLAKTAADIVTVSSDAPETNYRQAISGEPKFVTGPGEYEIAGVLIAGVRPEHARARTGEHGRNVAFVIDIDDIAVCHLGSMSEVPSADDVEALGGAGILILPVGGGSVLDASKAAETVSLLEPKIVIPMQYKTDAATGELDSVDKFLRELGAEAKPAESRLTITRSNLPHDMTVVLLNYRS